ncbi:MAG: PIN domain-containing protein [Synergistaceae bacterium]|nr:PIN domain-containing protein [Synergistaceae bacterium]MBR1657434.1 PIN domain-containing protein [Synergistaceae bacterium]
MRVLIDTNVVLDYLGANQNFTDEAEKVFDLAAERKDIKLVSSSAITDILYVLRRAVKDRETVRRKYESFRKKISILPVTEQDIDTAFARNWKDFEDAVQYTVAEANGVDCIVTRNKSDFEEDAIPSYTPSEFVEKFS